MEAGRHPLMRLSDTTLGQVGATVRTPAYDRSAIQVGVVHFGPGAFHRAHQAWYFDRMLAAEVTREQLYLQLHAELPYASAVETERYEERKDGSAAIHQQILVGRPTQRAIVLGKGGARIKAIGAAARAELEQLLGRKVHLFLHVQVKPDGEEDRSLYQEIGLDWVE